MKNIGSLIVLIISSILLISLAISLKYRKEKKSQMQSLFVVLLTLMVIWTYSLILQIFFQNSPINPVFFEC